MPEIVISFLIVYNLALLSGIALYCYATMTRSRSRAQQALLSDLCKRGMDVRWGGSDLPSWCKDALDETRGCSWWMPVPGELPVILYQEASGARRLVMVWNSSQAHPVHMALLINGRFARRSSPQWLPLQRPLRQKSLGWNKLKVYADNRVEADHLLQETDIGWTFLRTTPAVDRAFWYLAGHGVLLSDSGSVSSLRELMHVWEGMMQLERSLNTPVRGYDASLDPSVLGLPCPQRREKTALYVTGELWERLSMIAWMWFPYGVFTLGVDKVRVLGVQAGCAMLFSLLIVLFLLFIRKHRIVAMASSWTLGTYAGKESHTDSDGTAYWVLYDCEGIDGKQIRRRLAVFQEEWENIGPEWRTVIFRHPTRPAVHFLPSEMAMLPRDGG